TEHPRDVWLDNIVDDFGINGTLMRIYIQTGSTVRSILPWEHFLKFGNYDIIAIDSGIIKAATIEAGSLVLPEDTLKTSPFLDAQKMGYSGIYLCCINKDSLSALGVQLSAPHTIINGIAAYNLGIGFSFKMNSPTTPVKALFELWGVKDDGEEVQLTEDQYSLTFYVIHHTKNSISRFDNVPPTGLILSGTGDSLFTMLYNQLKWYDSTGRERFFIKGDSSNVPRNEKAVVKASAHNASLVFTQRLISKVDRGYTFPNTSPGGDTLPTIPPVGPLLDDYFGLYSNISGLLAALNEFKEGYTLYKDESDDVLQRYLRRWLENVVGNGDIDALEPSSFSHLILWYTDYLMYAGLCSYIDDDFFSRYINHHKLLVDQVKRLVDKVAPEYHYNNIVIRFYGVVALYEFLLNRGNAGLVTLTNYLDEYIDSTEEYGEGFGYYNYTCSILLPLIYLGMQEQHLSGPNSDDFWLPDTSKLVIMFRKIAENILNAATYW
ncbi:hypothetical protein DRN98_07925, partial [Methanosarcinales archaeon]